MVRTALAAFASRDVHTLLDLHAPDFESIPTPAAVQAGEPIHRGHAMMREWWERAWAGVDAVDYGGSEFIDAGDQVVVIARGAEHHRSGKVHKLFVPTVYTLRDGNLIEARVYESREAALEAVGLPE